MRVFSMRLEVFDAMPGGTQAPVSYIFHCSHNTAVPSEEHITILNTRNTVGGVALKGLLGITDVQGELQVAWVDHGCMHGG